MNLLANLKALATLTALVGTVSPQLTPEKLEISAAFPSDNQFGIVFNGQPNKILQVLKVLNLGRDPVEDVMRIHRVWNEFREVGGKERLLKKEGDIGLRIWVEWSGPKGKKHQSMAYDSTVTIQEPPTRWFDPQLILLYIILGSAFGGIGYMVYNSYVVPAKPARSLKPKPSAEAPLLSNSGNSKVATPTGASGAYEEEWIPAGHSVRSPAKKAGTGTGGEESSGGEGKARRRKR
ncbi:hypothetical protein H4Q26_013672 [Puccinia striiformis f. sp. tritici PST-130]|nr:hypothetical protein H4Q26_013672 [Puccinia striiformis f. sp. tritici PST-130]